MIWFTDYNIFISVKAYVIASQERRMYKLFKKNDYNLKHLYLWSDSPITTFLFQLKLTSLHHKKEECISFLKND